MDKVLLSSLKTNPSFGAIEYDEIIFAALTKSSASASESASASASSPKLIVLCGPPGCGKSTIKKKLIDKEGITDYIDIDPDEIRTILMTHGLKFSDDKTMAGITNAFNKRMSDQAQKMGLNIVFDTTGQNFMQVSSLLRESKKRGEKTIFAVIWASLDTCVRRVSSRNQHLIDSGSGRIQIPEEIVRGIYDKFSTGIASMYLIDYQVRPNELLLYNNNTDGAEPVLLFHKEERTVTSTDFPGFYNMDLHADGSITKIGDASSSSSTKKGAGKRKTKRVTYRKNKRSKTKRRRNKKTFR